MSDIVKKLRDADAAWERFGAGTVHGHPIFSEAAAEMERLTAENTALRNLANNLQPGPISEALAGTRYTREAELVAERDALRAALKALLAAKWCTPEYDAACAEAGRLLYGPPTIVRAANQPGEQQSMGVRAGSSDAVVSAASHAGNKRSSIPNEGPVYLPKITPELSEEYGDTDLMRFGAGQWNWSGTAVDFAALLNMHRLSSQTTEGQPK